MTHPTLLQTVLDATDARALAEFYRRLLGWAYRPGNEPPAPGETDTEAGWVVLVSPSGQRLAFQRTEVVTPSTWPAAAVPQQLHLDLCVRDLVALDAARDLARSLGASVLLDRTDDPDEPLWVLADPAGHPFCIFVSSAAR